MWLGFSGQCLICEFIYFLAKMVACWRGCIFPLRCLVYFVVLLAQAGLFTASPPPCIIHVIKSNMRERWWKKGMRGCGDENYKKKQGGKWGKLQRCDGVARGEGGRGEITWCEAPRVCGESEKETIKGKWEGGAKVVNMISLSAAAQRWTYSKW